jgi:hypothetical protein
MYDIPVYTQVTQSHYSNIFCAFCADDYLKHTPPSVHEILLYIRFKGDNAVILFS